MSQRSLQPLQLIRVLRVYSRLNCLCSSSCPWWILRLPRRKHLRLNLDVANIVFLFDIDNTLLDNDRVTADLKHHLEKAVGPERQQRYWDLFEQLRTELGYADYLGALQRYRLE